MFQIAVSDKAENAKALEYFYNKLLTPIKAAGGVIIKDSGADRNFVHAACEDEKSAPVRDAVTETLCDIICNAYKAAYFRKNLKMEAPCLFNFSTLVKTLVAFDREGDRDIVKRHCEKGLPETLALDGFFNFRMTELKDRWNTVIKLTAENALTLSNKDIFLEFISFMLTTIESKHKVINIHKNGSGYIMTDGQKKPVEMSELLAGGSDEEENLIASLIFFAPEKVILNFEDGISPKTLNILNILFDIKTKAK